MSGSSVLSARSANVLNDWPPPAFSAAARRSPMLSQSPAAEAPDAADGVGALNPAAVSASISSAGVA